MEKHLGIPSTSKKLAKVIPQMIHLLETNTDPITQNDTLGLSTVNSSTFGSTWLDNRWKTVFLGHTAFLFAYVLFFCPHQTLERRVRGKLCQKNKGQTRLCIFCLQVGLGETSAFGGLRSNKLLGLWERRRLCRADAGNHDWSRVCHGIGLHVVWLALRAENTKVLSKLKRGVCKCISAWAKQTSLQVFSSLIV